MKVLITGAGGFIGKNLCQALLERLPQVQLLWTESYTPKAILAQYAAQCGFVVHLAGVNRPKDEGEFARGNAGFTQELVELLERAGNACPVLMTSSIQAALDNPYGRSKLAAEQALQEHGQKTGAPIHLYRLPNVFGKFCRPNYNSAVATFCHNIARGLPIQVTDPAIQLNLIYVDDLVEEILAAIQGRAKGRVEPVHQATLGQIVSMLEGFRDSRKTLACPDTGDAFSRKLYATYLSYLPGDGLAYGLTMHRDARGAFTEFLRSPERGQMSVNTSEPGVTRGGHYHHTKNEKFLVVQGQGVIRLRRIDQGEIFTYAVSAQELQVVDIPPGYTHSIQNTGSQPMVTLMWCSECYDPANPDTYPMEVDYGSKA